MSSPSTSVLKGKTVLPADKIQQIGLLYAVNDKYGGVMVDMKEPMDSHIYVPLLRASISQWRQQGKKGVWIKLPIQLANLVEPTVKEGFRYHHAESDYLMLVHWIPDSPDALPANASHIVGIGAFVMNNKREVPLLDCSINISMLFSELKVLVVKEKHGYFEGKDVWKFPTGVVNQIDTEFMEILAFRQTHKQFLGKSDLFFVCMLRPLSFDITKQDSEIKAAQVPFIFLAVHFLVLELDIVVYALY
uniref:Pre-nudix hydrolase domain-containing protein n=1 Tax=Salix viminalis TaxID=40686 RepID=A0A6N2M0P5_SALVM